MKKTIFVIITLAFSFIAVRCTSIHNYIGEKSYQRRIRKDPSFGKAETVAQKFYSLMLDSLYDSAYRLLSDTNWVEFKKYEARSKRTEDAAGCPECLKLNIEKFYMRISSIRTILLNCTTEKYQFMITKAHYPNTAFEYYTFYYEYRCGEQKRKPFEDFLSVAVEIRKNDTLISDFGTRNYFVLQ